MWTQLYWDNTAFWLMSKVRQWLAAHSFKKLGFELSYSAGIAMRLHNSDSIENMLERADVALYKAKSQGRGCTLASSEVPGA